jgi:hypothetical protein
MSDLRPGDGVSGSDRPSPRTARSEFRDDAEHVYRIIGKVRFLVFWASADDVGGARITWRGGHRHQSVSLLIGSEPKRAPRQVTVELDDQAVVPPGPIGDASINQRIDVLCSQGMDR